MARLFKNSVEFAEGEMERTIAAILIEANDPEFNDCIVSDKQCFNVARELDKAGKLSLNKRKLLQKRVHEVGMVKMFGWGWWKKK